jgi:hypothetical protein
VLHPNGGYVATPRYFLDGAGAGDRVYGPLVVPTAENVPYYRQGSYQYGEALQFPTQSFNGASYYSDVTITTVDPALPPPVLLEDITLTVGRPTGNPLAIGAPQANPLTVGAPRGYDLILSEVTL